MIYICTLLNPFVLHIHDNIAYGTKCLWLHNIYTLYIADHTYNIIDTYENLQEVNTYQFNAVMYSPSLNGQHVAENGCTDIM